MIKRKTHPLRLYITLNSKTKRCSSLPQNLRARKKCIISCLSNSQLQHILSYLTLTDLTRLHEALYANSRTKQGAKTVMRFIAQEQRIYSVVELKQFLQYYILRKRKLNKWWNYDISHERNDIQRISWDVDRTDVWFCHSKQQIQNMRGFLSRVLNRLCGANSRYGYVQGFHCIVKAMYESKLNENESWMLGSYFLKQMRLGRFYQNKQQKMRQLCYVLDVYVFNNLPQLHYYLKKYDLSAQCYAISWFLTLFSQGLPLSVLNRLWVMFMMKGWKIIIKFAVALLCMFQQQLLMKQESQLPQFLCEIQQYLSYQKEHILWQLFSSIKVTNRMITFLSRSMKALECDTQISILQLKEMRDSNPNFTFANNNQQNIFPSHFSSGFCCEKIESPKIESPYRFPYCNQ